MWAAARSLRPCVDILSFLNRPFLNRPFLAVWIAARWIHRDVPDPNPAGAHRMLPVFRSLHSTLDQRECPSSSTRVR